MLSLTYPELWMSCLTAILMMELCLKCTYHRVLHNFDKWLCGVRFQLLLLKLRSMCHHFRMF